MCYRFRIISEIRSIIMSFRLVRRKLRPLEWIQKCWMHFYCFLVKEITKWAEIFTGWFYYISLDSCKVRNNLQTPYQCCAWALKGFYTLNIPSWFICQLVGYFIIFYFHGTIFFVRTSRPTQYPSVNTMVWKYDAISSRVHGMIRIATALYWLSQGSIPVVPEWEIFECSPELP